MSRRAQDPVIDGLLHAMVGVDYFSPWALAGVFVVAGFAPRDSRRWLPRTCALWARVFGVVRPAWRTHLGVQVPYRPGRGNC